MLIVSKLSTQGKSARQIASLLTRPDRSVSPDTIERWLARARAPVEDLQLAVASLRAKAVEGWETAITTGSKTGKHTPSRDLLMAAGVIENQAPIDRISIIVGDGSTVIGLLPSLPTQPLTYDHAHPSLPTTLSSTTTKPNPNS